MPLQRTFTHHTRPNVEELRQRLIQEWRFPQDDALEPLIQEDGGEMHDRPTRLRVIWNAWEGIEEFERSIIIMQAYEEVHGPEVVLYVISAEGLTFEEAKRRGIDDTILDS